MKKGTTAITVLFMLGVFVVVFVFWGGPTLGWATEQAVAINDLDGIEAFLLNNLMAIFIFIATIGAIGWLYFVGGRE